MHVDIDLQSNYSKCGGVLGADAPESEMGWTLGQIMHRHEWLAVKSIGPQVSTLGEILGLEDEVSLVIGVSNRQRRRKLAVAVSM